MKKMKYVVDLSDDQRDQLRTLVSSGTHKAKEILHANILLSADTKELTRQAIADRYHCHMQTVQKVCTLFARDGLERAVFRKKRETPPITPKITGDVQAKIIALSCSEPPEGYSQWSLRLLADKAVELDIIASISPKSVGRVLKKKSSTATSKKAMGHSTKTK